jgi:uncharacterized membrane protein YkvA (DUF1232 family)
MMSEANQERLIEIELNPKELRLYDRLRASVLEVRPGGVSGLGDLLLLLPDMVVLLFRLVRDPRVPLGSKLIAGAALGYVISPIDLMPEILLGPIGLIDDLLIVGAALSQLLKVVHPDVVRQHWPGQGDALDTIDRVMTWANEQVTVRISNTVRRLLGSFSGSGSGPRG